MPETEVGGRGLQGTTWIETGTTLVDEVWKELQTYDGGVTEVIVEIEYAYAGGSGTPAVQRCIAAVFEHFGPLPIGSICRPGATVAGSGGIPSQHASCNAIDWSVAYPGSMHRQLAYWLNANRSALSIHWIGADPYFPSSLGDHYDHVHVDFYPQY
jgi:hypothetical protein